MHLPDQTFHLGRAKVFLNYIFVTGWNIQAIIEINVTLDWLEILLACKLNSINEILKNRTRIASSALHQRCYVEDIGSESKKMSVAYPFRNFGFCHVRIRSNRDGYKHGSLSKLMLFHLSQTSESVN